jgi:hypothetical protein
MTKQMMALVAILSGAMAIFTVQMHSGARASSPRKAPDAENQQNMTETEKKREIEQQWKKRKLELERRQREFKKRSAERKNQWRLSQEKARQWRQELPEKHAEAKREFLYEKRALVSAGLTEEQWAVIKPKLEKVVKLHNLCELERSTSGLSLGSSSTGGTRPKSNANQIEPRWQWKKPWKDKKTAELSEAQIIAEQLIRLLDQKNATPEAYKRRMDTLRKARIVEEPEKQKREKELSEAQQELRMGLTARQEATLVLMGRL